MDFDLSRVQGDFQINAQGAIDSPIVGLFGASGSGKSTLLGMIAGLVTPSSGHLMVDGECLFDSNRGINMPLHQRRIGMVFQEGRLFPHLNVRDNLNYGFNLLAQKDKRFRFSQIVELLEIESLLAQKPHQLSGGEKQRVALGRALLASPRLLLLDEPLASLDMRLKQQILPFLRRVKEEIGIPMIYVSHAIDEILYLTSQIMLLEQGKLVAHGDFHHIMHENRVQTTMQSMGLENVFSAVVHKHCPEHGYSELIQGNQPIIVPLIQQACGETLTVSIAANQVVLSMQAVDNVTAENQLLGQICAIEQNNQRVIISINIAATVLKVETSEYALQGLSMQLGAAVYCLIKAQAVRVHGLLLS